MKKIVIILLILILGIFIYFLQDAFRHMNIVVKFEDLEPLEKQMNVYYKGFKVGRTIKIYPDKDYRHTYVKIKLHPRNINLPENITAKIRKSKIGPGYINLIYPDAPTLARIKNYTEIKGTASKDFNSVIDEKLDSETVDEIIIDTTNLIENANTAVKNLSDIFVEVKEVIQDSKNDIKLATTNLAKTSASLEEMARNLNSSLDKEVMSNSVNNIETTTSNIKNITEDLSEITNQIDKTTMPIVNSVLCQTHSTVKNVNEITSGVKNTLKKRFGLGKLMFGRPISNDCP